MTKKQKVNTTDTEKADARELELKESEDQVAIKALTQPDEVIEERELPKKGGEETSDIKSIGGALYRVVVTDDGTTLVPL